MLTQQVRVRSESLPKSPRMPMPLKMLMPPNLRKVRMKSERSQQQPQLSDIALHHNIILLLKLIQLFVIRVNV